MADVTPEAWVRMKEDDTEHKRCRLEEFRRWTRVVLEHEREHLSRVSDEQAPFLADDAKRGILHDITDIDWCLAQLGSKGE